MPFADFSKTAAFDPTGRWLAAMNGPDIEWWTADGSRLAASVPLAGVPAPSKQKPGRIAAAAEQWLGLSLRPLVKVKAGTVQAIAFHPREPSLIASTAEGLVSIPWSVQNEVLTTGTPRLRWSEAGAQLFSFCEDGTRAAVWSPSASQPGGRKLRLLNTSGTWRATGGTDVYFAAPRGPRWSADGRWLTDHVWHGPAAQVWDAQTGALAWQSAITSSWAGPHWTPDGQLWCATGLGEQTFRPAPNWTLTGDRPLPRGWEDFVNAAAFSPDGTLLATAPGSDGEIVLQHWPARTEILRWQPARGVSINALWFSPDSRRLAFTTRDRRHRLWDISESQEALEAAGFEWTVR